MSRITLVLTHPGALRRMFLPPTDLTLGEAYIYGDFNVEGDLIDAFRLADYFEHLELGTADKLWFGRQLLALPSTRAPQKGRQAARLSGALHSRAQDRRAISYHYDLSNRCWPSPRPTGRAACLSLDHALYAPVHRSWEHRMGTQMGKEPMKEAVV